MRKQQDGFVLEQFMSPRAILRFRFIAARWRAVNLNVVHSLRNLCLAEALTRLIPTPPHRHCFP
jgi:hypothetical protein